MKLAHSWLASDQVMEHLRPTAHQGLPCCKSFSSTGDSFGENALQGDNIRRNASVGCITNMELLILSREQYHEIVSDIADSIGTFGLLAHFQQFYSSFDVPLRAEFRPQLMHEKLAAAETGASKNEMLFTAVKKLHCFKDLPKPVLWQLVTSSTYESFENGDVSDEFH